MHRVSKVQRSKTGCWTCRLRRKKCNEGGPPCANCESRGVFCHGYGPKPPWKDRGEKEKEQASMLRIQTRQRRSHSENLSSDMLPQSSARSASIDDSGSNCERSTPVIHSRSQSDLSLSSLSSSQDLQAFEYLENLEIFSSWSGAESSNDFWPRSSSIEALVGSHDVQTSTEDLLPHSIAAPDSSHEPLLSPSSEALIGINDFQPSARSLRSNSWEDATGFSSDTWPGPSSAEIPHKVQGADLQPQPQAGYPQPRPAVYLPPAAEVQGSDTDERECELFMHFIGETFALQHTSYRTASTMQRSWLLLLLMRSPTFYYASLSMSAYHYYLNLSGDSEVRSSTFQAYQKYRTCALTRFYELLMSEPHSISSSGSLLGECMICGVQIALLEVRKPRALHPSHFRPIVTSVRPLVGTCRKVSRT